MKEESNIYNLPVIYYIDMKKTSLGNISTESIHRAKFGDLPEGSIRNTGF